MSDSLYDRVGGEAGIEKLVTNFYDRVHADPELAPFFVNTSLDKLKRMQFEFFSAALDGPIRYSGRPLNEVHRGRGITQKHFGLFVEHLLESLKLLDLSEQDIQDIISRINTYADQITGETNVDG